MQVDPSYNALSARLRSKRRFSFDSIDRLTRPALRPAHTPVVALHACTPLIEIILATFLGFSCSLMRNKFIAFNTRPS